MGWWGGGAGQQACPPGQQANRPTGIWHKRQETGIWHQAQETGKRAKPAGSLWGVNPALDAERRLLTYYTYTYYMGFGGGRPTGLSARPASQQANRPQAYGTSDKKQESVRSLRAACAPLTGANTPNDLCLLTTLILTYITILILT